MNRIVSRFFAVIACGVALLCARPASADMVTVQCTSIANAGSGAPTWYSPGGDDLATVTCGSSGDAAVSDALLMSGDWSLVPSDATITGVVVRIRHYVNESYTVRTKDLVSFRNGVGWDWFANGQEGETGYWPNDWADDEYGSSTSVSSYLDRAAMAQPDFAISLVIKDQGAVALVGSCYVDVYYTPAGGGGGDGGGGGEAGDIVAITDSPMALLALGLKIGLTLAVLGWLCGVILTPGQLIRKFYN